MSESLNQPAPAIILVEPQHPGNIGSVCRSMQNFGLDRLILVNPVDHLSDKCRVFAVHAFSIAQKAEIYSSLEDALAHVALSFGFTRRHGRMRSNDGPFHRVLHDLYKRQHNWLEASALVFGRENSGLTQEEALQCSFLVDIPTSPDNGSLNLSHAVTCACYELRRTFLTQETTTQEQARYDNLTQVRQQTYQSLTRFLNTIDFYSVEPPHIIEQHLEHWLQKSLMSPKEIRLLGKLVEKLRRKYEESARLEVPSSEE